MISHALKDFAVAQNIGVYQTDLFIRLKPDDPDNIITIYAEAGIPLPEDNDTNATSKGSKWLVRGTQDYAEAKAQEIEDKVKKASGQFTGIFILDSQIQTPSAFVETDSKGRAVYSVHFLHTCSIGAAL